MRVARNAHRKGAAKRDRTDGKTALGLSSPAKPALQLVQPTSITIAETSSARKETSGENKTRVFPVNKAAMWDHQRIEPRILCYIACKQSVPCAPWRPEAKLKAALSAGQYARNFWRSIRRWHVCCTHDTKTRLSTITSAVHRLADTDLTSSGKSVFFLFFFSVTVFLTYAYVCVCLRMLTYGGDQGRKSTCTLPPHSKNPRKVESNF